MQEISLIVAMNNERVIGSENKLPWHIPEDLAHFKALTLGKVMIMGRKTFESIGKILPGRTTAIISRNNFTVAGVDSYPSLEAAIKAYASVAEICIIGGGEVFQQALPLATKLHITWVDVDVSNPCAWFPEVDLNYWQLVNDKKLLSQNGINCHFCEYRHVE